MTLSDVLQTPNTPYTYPTHTQDQKILEIYFLKLFYILLTSSAPALESALLIFKQDLLWITQSQGFLKMLEKMNILSAFLKLYSLYLLFIPPQQNTKQASVLETHWEFADNCRQIWWSLSASTLHIIQCEKKSYPASSNFPQILRFNMSSLIL